MRTSREKRFDEAVLREFRMEDFAGLYVAGAYEPVARSLKEEGWPIRIGVTKSLEDTLTPAMDGGSPYWRQGLLFRVWARGWENVRSLEDWVKTDLLAGKEARKSYYCMGVSFSPHLFEQQIHRLAARRNLPVWDDALLMADLLRAVKQRMEKRARV